MEQLKQAATLLYAVLDDMDEIPVEGLENQKTFLNCADGIKTAAQVILQYVQVEESKAPTVLQEGGIATKDGIKEAEANGR